VSCSCFCGGDGLTVTICDSLGDNFSTILFGSCNDLGYAGATALRSGQETRWKGIILVRTFLSHHFFSLVNIQQSRGNFSS
jgi:hypothetical protein